MSCGSGVVEFRKSEQIFSANILDGDALVLDFSGFDDEYEECEFPLMFLFEKLVV